MLATIALVAATIVGGITGGSTPAEAASESPGNATIDFTSISGSMGHAYANNSQSDQNGYADNVRYGVVSSAGQVMSSSHNTPQSVSAYNATTYNRWSYVARGRPVGSNTAPPTISVGDTSALGFRPNYVTSARANETFLVGTIRHNNHPIYTNYSWLHSSIDVSINGVDESFQFDQNETTNNQNDLAVARQGGNYSVASCWSWAPGLIRIGSNCYVPTPGQGSYDIYSDKNIPYKAGNANQNPESDDILVIRKTTATRLVISAEGIPYRLVLWGFYNNGSSDSCPATPPADAQPVNTFTTKEGAVTYGCLYGSFNQERYVTINKVATADAHSQGVTIPEFSFSTDAQAGAESLADGTPDPQILSTVGGTVSEFVSDSSFRRTLKPSALGESGRDAYDEANGTKPASRPTTYYGMLVGRGDFTIQENLGSLSSNGGTRSGWDIADITCVNGEGDTVPATISIDRGTVSFENVGVAPSVAAVPITCTYTNHYTAKSTLTLRKTLTGNYPAGASPGQWPLTAAGDPADAVASGTNITGRHGTPAVTSQVVPSGSYLLSEVENPTGIGGFTRTGLSCRSDRTGETVPVSSAGRVTLADGDNVTCTFTNHYDTGELRLQKVLQDPEGNPVDVADANDGYTADGRFTLNWQCNNGQPVNGVTYSGSATVTANAPAVTVAQNIPIGIECAVSEDQSQIPQSALKNSSYHWLEPSASAPVTISKTTPRTLTITNRLVQDTATLRIAKDVAPEAGIPDAYTGGSSRTFPIDFTCALDGSTVLEGSVDVANDGVKDLTVPAGASCQVTEDLPSVEAGDFRADHFVWSSNAVDHPEVTLAKDTTETVTVTNRYTIDEVSLTVAKRVQGPDGVQDSGYIGTASDLFTINVTCPDIGTQTVQIPAGGSETIQVPRGAGCEVVEPVSSANFDEARLGSDYDWNTDAIAYEGLDGGYARVTSSDGATVTVVNETKLSFGGISVAKVIDPDDASGVDASTTFDFVIACENGFTTTASLRAGEVWRTPEGADLLAGTDCTVTEVDLTGTSTGFINDSYRWTGTSWEVSFGVEHDGDTGTGTEAVVTAHAVNPADPAHPYPRVTFTNSFERVYGTFDVTKVLDHGNVADPSAGMNVTYTGTWTCTPPGGSDYSGTWTRVGSGIATMTVTSDPMGFGIVSADGTTVSALAGTSCEVTEDRPTESPLAGDSTIFFSGNTVSVPVVIQSDEASHLTVTNLMAQRTTGLSLHKTVEGGQVGTAYDASDDAFSFDVTCTPQTGEAVSASTVLAGNELHSDLLTPATGSTCTVTETAWANLKDPYRWDPENTRVEITDGNGQVIATTSADPEGRSFTFRIPADNTTGVLVDFVNVMSEHTAEVKVTKSVASANKDGFVGGSEKLFPVTLSCKLPGSDQRTPVGPTTSLADGETVSFEVPIGSSDCVVVEGSVTAGLRDASYAWNAPSYDVSGVGVDPDGDGIRTIVEGEDNGTAVVTNSIRRVYGTIDLTKQITGSQADGSSLQGRDVRFSGTFVCRHEGDADVTGTWQVTGPGSAQVTVMVDGSAVDVSRENSVLLLGSECEASEDTPQDPPNATNARYHWGKVGPDAIVTSATVSNNLTNNMTVANEVIRPITNATVKKSMSDEDKAALSVAGLSSPFRINATCAPTADLLGDFSSTVNVTVDGSETIEIPRGWYCRVSEATPSQDLLKDSSYRWEAASFAVTSGGAAVSPEAGTTNVYKLPDDAESLEIVATNSVARVYGSLELTKAYGATASGAGIVNDDATFTGSYTCSYDGAVVSSGTWSRTGAGEASFTSSADSLYQSDASGDLRLPLTTVCWATEDALDDSDLRNVSWTWTEPTVSHPSADRAVRVVSETQPAAIRVTNDAKRVYSSLTIEKEYTGDLAALDEGATVEVVLNCVTPEGATISGTYDLNARGISNAADGSASKSFTPDGDVKIPAGSTCTINEETLNNDPASGQLSDSSWVWLNEVYSSSTNGQDFVTEGDPDAPQVTGRDYTLTLRVTNATQRVFGSLAISKIVPDATTRPTNVYGGEWTCTAEDGTVKTGTWSRSGSGDATVTGIGDSDGDGVEDARILVGSTCTVSETRRPDVPNVADASYQWVVGMDEVPVAALQNAAEVDGQVASKVASRSSQASLSITNASERHFGSFKVTKELAGATDGVVQDDDAVYGVVYTCNPGLGDPVNGIVQVKAGQTVDIGLDAQGNAIIPLGASCTIYEIPPGTTFTDEDGNETDFPTNLVDGDLFTWNPTIRYVSEELGPSIVNPGSPSGNGYTFILPATAANVQIINQNDPIAAIEKNFVATTQHLVDPATLSDPAGTPTASTDDDVWDGTWDVAYTITVTNPSTEADLRYALKDTPTLPEGSELLGVTVTGPDGTAVDLSDQTIASGEPLTLVPEFVLPEGASFLPDGTAVDVFGNVIEDPRAKLDKGTAESLTSHTYTVVLRVKAREDGAGVAKPDAAACEAIVPGDPVTTIHNQADVTSAGELRSSEDCGNIPSSPTFSVTKTNADTSSTQATRNPDGSYTAVYTVTVTNTSAEDSVAEAKIIADVEDTLGLPSTATLTAATVSERGVEGTTALDITAPTWVLAEAGSQVPIPIGGTRVFTVTATFEVDSSDPAVFQESEYVCGGSAAEGYTSGLINMVSMSGDTTTGDDAACQELFPRLRVEKSLVANGSLAGTSTVFDATYAITVTNDGALAQSTGVVADVPEFAAGLTINSAKVARTVEELDAADAVEPDNGAYVVTDGLGPDDIVAPGGTQVYYIRFNVTLDPAAADYSAEALECEADPATGWTRGRGLFNEVIVGEDKDSDGTANNTACGPVNPDSSKRIISIKKTGTQVNASGENGLAGAEFVIYAMDPMIAGATPIEGGVVVDPNDGSLFTSAALEVNKDYWLVETKAPAGHQLMPRPVKFHLAVDGNQKTTITIPEEGNVGNDIVTVIDEQTDEDGVLITAIGIKVHDVEVGKLPHSGGRGVTPFIAVAVALMGASAGMVIINRRRKRA